MTRDEFTKALERIQEVTLARTQVELADVLEIRQSSVSDAKRRATVPDSWLVKLLDKLGVNPGWILTGHGPRYLVGADKPGEVALGEWSRPEPPEPEPVSVTELIQAIKDREPGAKIFVAIGDPQALDLGALRVLAELPAAAVAAGQ